MTPAPWQRALAHVRALAPDPGPPVRAPITVNFHPDRLLADGRTVVEHLAAGGVYRSQFETGISNGGLNAAIDGARERWEHRMFAGAYTGPVGRPVYGALNLAGHPDGASPRFGSCHLVLRPHVTARATFSHGDSVTEPTVVGTADTFGAIWAALLAEVAATGCALGLPAASAPAWAAALTAPRTGPGRCLDGYVEAQIHGGLDLRADVAAAVADPSFRGTPVEGALSALGVAVRWHQGFRLPASAFSAQLRGPGVPPLAAYIAERFGAPVLDAEVIGRAARAVVRDPLGWAGFGAGAQVLQHIKYLWHILVLQGH